MLINMGIPNPVLTSSPDLKESYIMVLNRGSLLLLKTVGMGLFPCLYEYKILAEH